MILVRLVFQATFGKGGELARLLAEGTAAPPGEGRWRLLTDLSSGPFDTVVLELEQPSLAAWEERRGRVFAAPAFRETMARTAALIESGRSELYTIEAQGG